jgi:adenine-specific DNA-methyltransferase
MTGKKKTTKGAKRVEALLHEQARRKNIPTAELQSIAERIEESEPMKARRYRRATPLPKGETRPRDPDLDPQLIWNGARIRLSPDQVRQLQEVGQVEIGDAQLVWRGKDRQDWSDLVVQAPPLYIQEKVHPKVIIEDLIRRSKRAAAEKDDAPDLFTDFNGLDDPEARLEFYQHNQNWSNRLILGDSLHVMASLAERERLRGQVQCIYIDPPYGIEFNSNWQVSTLSRDVKDGKREDVSREPEQVKAFRDTWRDGIHSYLTYLRDRLIVARELLSESGSIFVQIGDENVHRVRALMDEVFGQNNFISAISVQKTYGFSSTTLSNVCDYFVWYARNIDAVKVRPLYSDKTYNLGKGNATWLLLEDFTYRGVNRKEKNGSEPVPVGSQLYNPDNLVSQGRASEPQPLSWRGVTYDPYQRNSHWKAQYPTGIERLIRAERVHVAENSFRYRRFNRDFPLGPFSNIWTDTGTGNFTDEKIYVVQTGSKAVERCVLMATDPGDLILDPTCGSGTTAYVAEQWGRRWITIDTSRVALALARGRIMGARYSYYYLADTPPGRSKEQEVTGKIQSDAPTHGDVRQGFVYQRAPHVKLEQIANNAEIDVIWETFQARLDPLRAELNAALGESWEEWEVSREADASWSENVKDLHKAWWEQRIERQKKIDESIAKNAGVEFLYDRPYEDKSRVRVAGPFTVESLSPHRVVPADEEELIDALDAAKGKRRRSKLITPPTDFVEIVLEHLRTAGVHQAEKKDAIKFTSLQGWPGQYIGAEGRFMEGQTERRAAVFFGPEFGTVSRVDLVAAAREATEARFDVLIACAFNFDAHASELSKLGPLPILKAKMNPDLHMADELKNTGKGNLFVVFGEPDIDVEEEKDGRIRVQVKGVDVFDPNTGEIRSNDTEGIAAWFVDTDYDEQNFFVRHAYFLGAQDPYKSLKTALKAEIDEDAWATLYRDTSRPFPRPSTGCIAVKVINHFGDEVMKVFAV